MVLFLSPFGHPTTTDITIEKQNVLIALSVYVYNNVYETNTFALVLTPKLRSWSQETSEKRTLMQRDCGQQTFRNVIWNAF